MKRMTYEEAVEQYGEEGAEHYMSWRAAGGPNRPPDPGECEHPDYDDHLRCLECGEVVIDPDALIAQTEEF